MQIRQAVLFPDQEIVYDSLRGTSWFHISKSGLKRKKATK